MPKPSSDRPASATRNGSVPVSASCRFTPRRWGVAVGVGVGVAVRVAVGVGVDCAPNPPLGVSRRTGDLNGSCATAGAAVRAQRIAAAIAPARRTRFDIKNEAYSRRRTRSLPLVSVGLMEAQAATAAPSARARLEALRGSDTAQVAGLAGATIALQLTAVVFTVIFTRILGTNGYGSLAALINFSIILMVPGSALQVAAARQGMLGRLGTEGELAGTLARWTRHIGIGIVVVAVASILARKPLAELVNVDEEWAAASVPVTAMFWLLLCVERGLLQAARAYKPVANSILAEGPLRIVTALILVAALDVTGAYLGLLVAWAGLAVALNRILRRRLGAPDPQAAQHPLTALARNAAIPTAGLIFVAALQNVDVIMARHALDHDAAGVYAATTVAAKFIVWVSVGIGMWVLPEATRRAADGLDPRPVLARAVGLIALISVGALTLFGLFPTLLLRLAFGSDYESGDSILFMLGVAFCLLACTYVTVQFLLGLHRRAFVIGLLITAAAEPIVLANASSLRTFATRVLILQAITAAGALLAGALTRRDDRAGVADDGYL
jgi:O-antigen/teichoic acid export membrane protein